MPCLFVTDGNMNIIHYYTINSKKSKRSGKVVLGQISWPPLIKQRNNSIIYKNVHILLQKYILPAYVQSPHADVTFYVIT